MLEGCEEPRASDCIQKMFAPSSARARGCFICNAMVELAPENPQVAARVNAMSERLKNGVIGVIGKHGIGTSDRHRSELADVVLHLYFGHQAMGKSGAGHQDWQERLRRILGEE